MSQAHSKLTLNLPAEIYERVRRAAKGMKKPMAQAVVNIVAGATPSLERVPLAYRPELEAMEDLADDELWHETTLAADPTEEHRLQLLLKRKLRRPLTEDEQMELDGLHAQADLLMLRRSYAHLLLKYRGHRIPSLADMKP